MTIKTILLVSLSTCMLWFPASSASSAKLANIKIPDKVQLRQKFWTQNLVKLKNKRKVSFLVSQKKWRRFSNLGFARSSLDSKKKSLSFELFSPDNRLVAEAIRPATHKWGQTIEVQVHGSPIGKIQEQWRGFAVNACAGLFCFGLGTCNADNMGAAQGQHAHGLVAQPGVGTGDGKGHAGQV